MSVLSRPYFFDEAKACAHLENVLWDGKPVCPKCGALDRIYVLDGVKDKKGRVRLGLKKCGHCKSQFTVRVGTVFESAHIPLTKILQAVHLMCASKKGISAHQMHRTLEITYKSAWFLCHRIREAMRSDSSTPLGGLGKIVAVDETFIGNKFGFTKGNAWGHKMKVLSLVERVGAVRSSRLANISRKGIEQTVRESVNIENRIMTDKAPYYKKPFEGFAGHETVDHGSDEYVRGEAHTNTLEGYFSIFKRGMKGVYQHYGEQHLKCYLAEFDFRYSNRVALGVNDDGRTFKCLSGAFGRRLMYQTIDSRGS
jgi:transposase-like protein